MIHSCPAFPGPPRRLGHEWATMGAQALVETAASSGAHTLPLESRMGLPPPGQHPLCQPRMSLRATQWSSDSSCEAHQPPLGKELLCPGPADREQGTQYRGQGPHLDPGLLAQPKPWLRASLLSGRLGSQMLRLGPKVQCLLSLSILLKALLCSATFSGSPLPQPSPLNIVPNFSSFAFCLKGLGLALPLFLPGLLSPHCQFETSGVSWSKAHPAEQMVYMGEAVHIAWACYSWIFPIFKRSQPSSMEKPPAF